jgi:hypothetical protein
MVRGQGSELRAKLTNFRFTIGAIMEMVLANSVPLAAVGYSLIYMLLGGGLLGAGVIFVVAKMLGK